MMNGDGRGHHMLHGNGGLLHGLPDAGLLGMHGMGGMGMGVLPPMRPPPAIHSHNGGGGMKMGNGHGAAVGRGGMLPGGMRGAPYPQGADGLQLPRPSSFAHLGMIEGVLTDESNGGGASASPTAAGAAARARKAAGAAPHYSNLAGSNGHGSDALNGVDVRAGHPAEARRSSDGMLPNGQSWSAPTHVQHMGWA